MNKGRILIIDDDVSQLELLTLFFCSRGHEVKCSSTAVEGLALNETFHPDIIILDVRLPDIEGLELLKELSRRNLNCRISSTMTSSGAGRLRRKLPTRSVQ